MFRNVELRRTRKLTSFRSPQTWPEIKGRVTKFPLGTDTRAQPLNIRSSFVSQPCPDQIPSPAQFPFPGTLTWAGNPATAQIADWETMNQRKWAITMAEATHAQSKRVTRHRTSFTWIGAKNTSYRWVLVLPVDVNSQIFGDLSEPWNFVVRRQVISHSAGE